MKIRVLIVLWLLLIVGSMSAQVTTSPSPLQENSQNVVIYFNASQGNKGLMGVAPPAKIYAHTGVITSKSTTGSDWKYAPTWGTNSAKYELTYVSENLWSLTIGDLRTYYGITDPTETIKQLAFVFRSADNKKEGKTASGGDIFVDVVDAGLQISLVSNPADKIISSDNNTVDFAVGTTMNADIILSVNGFTIASQTATTLLTTSYTFNDVGNYEVVAKATANGETVSTTAEFFYPGKSAMMAYPGVQAGVEAPPMGPVANADGTVTFCVAAPGKKDVVIVGAWNDYALTADQLMNYTTDANGFEYFWWTSGVLDANEMYGYYFVVDGSITVGDPYARLVLDPDNDKWISTDVFPNLPQYPSLDITNVPLAIYQGCINDYDWKVENFQGASPSNLIIYEMLFRDFTGTEGEAKGNGTVRGAIEKIPYLVSLGVNAVEVLPIMEFEGNVSWGYNPNFYFAPDKAYGTPADYKEFIDVCHQNGIAVILDMVFNQSDSKHPWYQMYMPGENPFYNADAPHAYSVLNDWNQGYPLVRQQWEDVITYWLTEYKFDGFRFDLVKGLGDNDSYANSGTAATDMYNPSRVANMLALQEVVASVNPNAYFINENLASAQEENEMAATGQLNWANVNNAGCQFAMGYSSDSNMNRLYAPLDDKRLWGSTVSYLESHDEQRLAYKQDMWGVAGVKGDPLASTQRLGSAAAQMLMSPGAHMIWQFSEMGNAQNTKTDQGNNTDPKIVDWSLLDNPFNHGLWTSYSTLIGIRTAPENAKLFAEDATFTMACDEKNWNYGRWLYSVSADKTMELFTVINPNVEGRITVNGVPFSSRNNGDYYIASQSNGGDATFDASTQTVELPANCYVVIVSNNVAELESVPESPSDGRLEARAVNGEISIVRAPGVVSVFSMDGVLMGRLGVDETLNVTPGVYILRCGSEWVKLLAK